MNSPKKKTRTTESKRQRFVEEYVKDFNATKAAIRAGYSAHTASQQGSHLLGIPHIIEQISQKREHLSLNSGVTTERIIQEYARLGFLDIKELFDEEGKPLPVKDMPEDSRRAISGLEVERRVDGRGEDSEVFHVHKIKLADKVRALDALARINSMFHDNVNHTGLENLGEQIEAARARLKPNAHIKKNSPTK